LLEGNGLPLMEKKDKRPQRFKDSLLRKDSEEREYLRKKRRKDG